jgi:hypothetical protein
MREAPISSELFASSILVAGRGSALSSVQSGAIRNWPGASRPAPFSAPDGTTVGTFFAPWFPPVGPSVPVARATWASTGALLGMGGKASTASC